MTSCTMSARTWSVDYVLSIVLCTPPVRFVGLDIFKSDLETMHERSLENPINPSNYGTSFCKGKARFNQFGTMEGAISGSKFLNNPGPFPTDGWEPASSSRGNESCDRASAKAHISLHLSNQLKSRHQIFRELGETLKCFATGPLHPTMEPTTEGMGGDQTTSTGASPLNASSSASSPHELGGALDPPPLQHLARG
jgi:hypothetical protein